MNEPKLKLGDYIIALEDFIIPSIGLTYCIYKGKYYKLTEYFLWNGEHAWHIEPIMNRKERRELYRKDYTKRYDAYLTESTLLGYRKFDCKSVLRREKLKRLQKISI